MPSVYLYGFIDLLADPDAPRFRAKGLAGAPVTVLYEEGVGALVGAVHQVPVRVHPDLLLAHENVLERALVEHTVLPVAFGTVATTRAEVRDLIKRHGEVLRPELERLRDLVEFGFKVYWRREALVRELTAVAGDLEGQRTGATANPDYRRARAIQVGQEVEALVQRWRGRYEDAVFAGVRTRAHDMRLGDPIGPRMMWNTAFLVDRSDATAFEREVGKAKARFGERFTFRSTGPLPPHSFVSLRLR